MRWWNVQDVTPSGLRMNRAWKIRQFLLVLVTPACTWVMLESVTRWDKRQVAKRILIEKNSDKNGVQQKQAEPEPEVSISQFILSKLPEDMKIKAIGLQDEASRSIEDAIATYDAKITEKLRDFSKGDNKGEDTNLFIKTFRETVAKVLDARHIGNQPCNEENEIADSSVERVQDSLLSPMRIRRAERSEEEKKDKAYSSNNTK
jgi:hypothetical protein